jgi:hypothetical protein
VCGCDIASIVLIASLQYCIGHVTLEPPSKVMVDGHGDLIVTAVPRTGQETEKIKKTLLYATAIAGDVQQDFSAQKSESSLLSKGRAPFSRWMTCGLLTSAPRSSPPYRFVND